MPNKVRNLPHPSTLVEKQPDDDVLFRERYKALKALVYEIEDENNIIGYKSAQALARVLALRAEYAQRQEQALSGHEERTRAGSSASRPTTTPPFSPPRRQSTSFPTPQPQPQQQPQSSSSHPPRRQSLIPPAHIAPLGPPPLQSAESTYTSPAPASVHSQTPTERTHVRNRGSDASSAYAGGGGGGGGNNAAALASASTTATGSVRRNAPLIGPNGEEDELMSDD